MRTFIPVLMIAFISGLAVADDVVIGWGDARLVVPDVIPPMSKVVAGNGFNLGLRVDGSVLAWGLNAWRACDVPAPNSEFVDVAAGSGHSLGLRADGSIAEWGDWASEVPFPNSDFVGIAAGHGHSLGLKSDGSIVAWGGTAPPPSPNTGFVAIAAGANNSLGLKADGSIVAWRTNSYLGYDVPAPNTGFVAVAVGSGHNLGLKTDGSIVAWGENGSGQCSIPSPNTGFTAIAAGYEFSLGLKGDGSIVAWGNNSWGQCNVPSPNVGFSNISAKFWHCVARRADGSIASWGQNSSGECVSPSTGTGFQALSAGQYHFMGLKSDGSIVAWGDNMSGACNVPLPNVNFVAVDGGPYFSLGLKADGSIVGWGENGDGQCEPPYPNSGFVAMAAGMWHSLGLKADGTIVAWGWDGAGQCDVPTPNANFTAVAAREELSAAVRADGSIVVWGADYQQGQEEVPQPNSGFVSVDLGNAHCLGLKTDGSIVAWGSNQFGQCDVPLPNTGFVAIAAGDQHSIGLKNDGSIVAWGWNTNGRCDAPLPNTGFVAIAASGAGSLGVRRLTTVPPMAPANLTATSASSDAITVTWTDAANNENSFELERKASSTGSWSLIAQLPTNSTTWTDTGLIVGQEYYYRVRARNGVGYSGYSNMARATAGAYLTPPTITSVKEVPEGVLITWTPTTDPKVGYRVWRRSMTADKAADTEVPNQCSANATQTIDRAPLANGVHGWCVSAYDRQCDSQPSQIMTLNVASGDFEQRTVQVTLEERPIRYAEVYTGDDLRQRVGVTDENGECIVLVRKGAKLRATYVAGTRSTSRLAHDGVDNSMYTVIFDSDRPSGKGHRHEAVLVSSGSEAIGLNLQHVRFRLNLVVAAPYSIESRVEQVRATFQRISDFIGAVTDGYVELGKVALYDNCPYASNDHDVTYGADIACYSSPGKPDYWSGPPFADAPQTSRPAPFFADTIRRQVHANSTISDAGDVVVCSIAHELLHYRFELLDEYNLPNGTARSDDFAGLTLRNYGVMDHRGWRGFLDDAWHPPYASTATDYRNYSNLDDEDRTQQYYEYQRSAWEQIRDFFASDWPQIQWFGGVAPERSSLTLFALGNQDLDREKETLPTADISFERRSYGASGPTADAKSGATPVVRAWSAGDGSWPWIGLSVDRIASSPNMGIEMRTLGGGGVAPKGTVFIGGSMWRLAFDEDAAGVYKASVSLPDTVDVSATVGLLETQVPDESGVIRNYNSWFTIADGRAHAVDGFWQYPARFVVEGVGPADSTLVITWGTTLDCEPDCANVIGPSICGVATSTDVPGARGVAISYYFANAGGVSADSLAICTLAEGDSTWVPLADCVVNAMRGVASGSSNRTGQFALMALTSQRDRSRPARIADLVAMTALGDGRVELDWSSSGDDSTDGDASAYIAAWSDSAITGLNWPSQRKVQLTNTRRADGGHIVGMLDTGESSRVYHIAVRAVDDAGNASLVSNSCVVVSGRDDPNLVPAAPTAFVAEDSPLDHGGAIRLRWHLSADDGSGKMTVEGYRVFRQDRITRESVPIAEMAAGASTYLDTLVSVGRIYDYWISAVDSIQESTSQREFAAACADSGALAGDFSSDARVDLRDLALLAPHLDVSADSTRYDALYDVIPDSRIDEVDADFVAAAFGSGLPVVGDPAGDNAAARLVLKVSYGASDSTIVDVCASGAKNLAGYSFTLAFPGADSRLLGSTPYESILSGTSLTSQGSWAPLRTVRQPELGLLHLTRVVTDPDETMAASGTAWLERIVFSGKGGIDLSMIGATVIDCKSRLNVLGWDVSNVTDGDVPGATVLFQSRPNPFNGRATIQYRTSQRGQVNVAIYDLRGRKVRQLVQEAQPAGDYTVTWDAKDGQGRSVASGCYFCKMITEDYDQTRKVMLVK